MLEDAHMMNVKTFPIEDDSCIWQRALLRSWPSLASLRDMVK